MSEAVSWIINPPVERTIRQDSVQGRNNWQKPVQTRKRQYCFCRMENQRFIIIVTEILWEPEMKMQMKIGGEISITGAAVPAPPIPRQTK